MNKTIVLLFALCVFIVPNFAITLNIKEDVNITETVTGSTCEGNCPTATCPSCLCGTDENLLDIASWCSKYSWDQTCCQCIMSHESKGNANAAHYNSNGSYDIGLFQINERNWDSCSEGKAPCDPSTNLGCARKVYQWGGNTWKLWATCNGCGCCSSN